MEGALLMDQIENEILEGELKGNYKVKPEGTVETEPIRGSEIETTVGEIKVMGGIQK